MRTKYLVPIWIVCAVVGSFVLINVVTELLTPKPKTSTPVPAYLLRSSVQSDVEYDPYNEYVIGGQQPQ